MPANYTPALEFERVIANFVACGESGVAEHPLRGGVCCVGDNASEPLLYGMGKTGPDECIRNSQPAISAVYGQHMDMHCCLEILLRPGFEICFQFCQHGADRAIVRGQCLCTIGRRPGEARCQCDTGQPVTGPGRRCPVFSDRRWPHPTQQCCQFRPGLSRCDSQRLIPTEYLCNKIDSAIQFGTGE